VLKYFTKKTGAGFYRLNISGKVTNNNWKRIFITQMDSKMAKQSPKLFSPWPCFGDDEIGAVTRVLRSGNVNQWTGPEVTGFENEYADYVGVNMPLPLQMGAWPWISHSQYLI